MDMTRDASNFKVGHIERPPSTADEDSHAVLAISCSGGYRRLCGNIWEFRDDPSWMDFHACSEGRPMDASQA